MVGQLKLHGLRDHATVRGFAAQKGWVKSMLRRRSARVENA